jgi:uncharacterized protein (DUF362 family)/Fe-S-cluster-containing hydrogenase component 2
MNPKTVSLQSLATYDQESVDVAIQTLLDNLGGISNFVKPNQRVVLKANLVMGYAPERAITTHPSVITAVAKLVRQAGATPIIADSAGGLYNHAFMNSVYKKTGMTRVAETGIAELNQDFTETELDFSTGIVAKKIPLINVLATADVIINVCKLKTHCFTGISAATKNMYGAIPGLTKVQWHQYFQDLDRFADCLIDINESLRPKLSLHIVDGVVGMEGQGPTSGKPVSIGALVASSCPYSADVACSHIIGEQPCLLPSISQSVKRGLLNPNYDIQLVGTDIQSLIKRNFDRRTPASFSSSGLVRSRTLRWLIGRMAQRPIVSKRKCKGCNKCKEHCPVDAVDMKSKKKGTYAAFDLDKCIRCFCCQELCPFHLVSVKSPLLGKMLTRHRRRKAARVARKTSKASV